MKLTLKTVVAAMALLGAMDGAFAADVINIPGITTTGNVTLATDYRFRGVSQTSNNPAIQGGINFKHDSGVYLSLWGSNVSFAGSIEGDATLGFATALNDATTLDVGYIRYGYEGSGSPQPDFNEFFGKLSYSGLLMKDDSLTGAVNYSPDYFAQTDHFWYLSASYAVPLADTGFGVVASVGYNKFKHEAVMATASGGDGEEDTYVDYKLGTTFGIQGLTAELSWIGTTINGGAKDYDNGVVFSLSKFF
ncbi:TorF family putative porin [Alkanindiges sp. WGS2144]|uniref:TorF family putative porin n=1 Tax=Alkanindiges sp. WGS2144 TaxID=3366808 RepID=UPI003750D510